MKLTTEQKKQVFAMCLEMGVDLSTKKVSLCNLSNHKFSELNQHRGYQVHSDKWSRIYTDAEAAVDKFVELTK